MRSSRRANTTEVTAPVAARASRATRVRPGYEHLLARWRVAPGALEMCEADELAIALSDLLGRERQQTLDAEGLAGERAQDVAVDQRAAVIRLRHPSGARHTAGEIAQEAPREGVACARRVAHVFERVGWRSEEATARAKHHRAVRALFDDEQFGAPLQNIAGGTAQAG